MKYIYTATFVTDPDSSTVYARVPDLDGCITTGHSFQDAIDQITDAANLWLVVAEDEGDEIPLPTPQHELNTSDVTAVSLIQLDTLQYRSQTDTRAVRKNVSLPYWMSSMADKLNINCSQLLQEALLARFQ